MRDVVGNKSRLNVAVVGAGIFGTTTALELSKNNHIDLYESKNDILQVASGINQLRLHRGYHYPRSEENASLFCREFEKFHSIFSDCVIMNDEYYYCIAREDSKTSAEQYLAFCEKHKLEYKIEYLESLNKEKISLSVKVREGLLDYFKFKRELKRKISESKINLILNTRFDTKLMQRYDFVVVCTYASLNYFLRNYPEKQRKYKFQVCEKPVVRLPDQFRNISIVIFDGPFLALDPYGKTGFHLMTHVKHAVHSENVGTYPEFEQKLLPVINKGIIKNPAFSNFNLFEIAVKDFIPGIGDIKYIGSMFTVKTVLPYMEETDIRPTLVEQVNEKLFSVFGGKIVTCVSTAEKISELINSRSILKKYDEGSIQRKTIKQTGVYY